MNVIVDCSSISGEYVVCKAFIESYKANADIVSVVTGRYNIFGMPLEDIVTSTPVYIRRWRQGEALSSGFKDENSAIEFCKQNGYTIVQDFGVV